MFFDSIVSSGKLNLCHNDKHVCPERLNKVTIYGIVDKVSEKLFNVTKITEEVLAKRREIALCRIVRELGLGEKIQVSEIKTVPDVDKLMRPPFYNDTIVM
jgi:hypothetical protein